MKRNFFKIVVNTISVFIVAWLLSGIHLENHFTAILVAIALALLNTFLRPLLILLTIPFSMATLGVFLLVINAGMVMLAGEIVPGFTVSSFWTALWFSILVPTLTFFLELPEKFRQNQIIIKRVVKFGDDPFKDTKRQSNDPQDFQDAEVIEDEESLRIDN